MNPTPARAARVALAVVAASAFLGATAEASADPLDCDAIVHDADELLDRTRLDPVIRTVVLRLDADVRIRVEGTLDAGLDRRIDQLVDQCPGWQDDDTDELADDMVIVSFSRAERENSIYYGADMGPELEDRWDAATDAMIPGLRSGDFTDAVVAGLRGLTRDPVQSTTSGSSSGSPYGASSSADDTGDDDSGGVPGAVVFALVVVGLVVVLSIVGKQQGWSSAGGGSWDGEDGGSTSWFGGSGSGRRRSSFRSFGSRSRSSGGGSRRSGGGSRRAGGGSKKW